MTEKEKIGKQILKLRKKTPSSDYKNEHISQQELADKNFGLTKYLIGTVERGEANPTLEKMILLAKALNLKTIDLFGIEINIDKFIKELENEKMKKG
ncbi:MAG: helix-turn-helix transcriptional regulator [Flavobacteriaceae bacterium]